MGDVDTAVLDTASTSATNQLWHLEQKQGTTSGSTSSEDFRDFPLGPALWPQHPSRAELQANTTHAGGQALQIQSFMVLTAPPPPPQQSALLSINSNVHVHANWQRDVASLSPSGENFLDSVPSVQFSSAAQLHPTLCNPMDCSTPGLLVHHQLPEFTHTHVH